jgi:bifunctional non-homologous end joining protein LigD
VATPLEWDELNDPELHPRRWTLRDVAARVEDRGDPWSDMRRDARGLPAG